MHGSRGQRLSALMGGVALLSAGLVGLVAEPAAADSRPFGPGVSTFQVPAGVTSIQFEVMGAGGGSGDNSFGGTPGTPGRGAALSGTLSVTPCETLQVDVGSQGGAGTGATAGAAGGNGGAVGGAGGESGGGGGGGASDI